MREKTPQGYAAGFPRRRLPVLGSTASLRCQPCSVSGFPLPCLKSCIPHRCFPRQEPVGLPKFFDIALPACRGLWAPADRPLLAKADRPVWPSGALKPSASAPRLFEAVPALQGARSPLRPPGYAVDASPILFAVFPRLRLGRKTRDGWVARPYPTGTFTLPEMPSLSWRDNRDRGRPHGLTPPTPPYIRITYTAVRWLQSGTTSVSMKARDTSSVKIAPW
jgi:hypothetical protein